MRFRSVPILNIVLGLVILAIVLVGFASAARNSSGSTQPVGLQLYSLRAEFAKDVPGTLDKVRDFGIQYVELAGTYGVKPEKFKAQLHARGIKPISGHFPYERFRDDLNGLVKEAKSLGLKYIGCAWIAHKGPFTEHDCRDTIKVFNKAGEELAQHGIRFFYHTHGYEFQPFGSGTLFDLLLK